jgi:transcriptional regulator with XRE-family HTH domain
MNEILPINKDVFIWARTSIGLSVEDVAHKLNKNPREIEEWEKGNASPTYLQLEHLAHDIYKRPIALFFFPKVPFEDSPNKGYSMNKIVEEILDTKLSHFKYNCPLDITDLVFLEIEKSFLTLYKAKVKNQGSKLINRTIGAKVKEHWNLENRGICKRPKSKLIYQYLEHGNIQRPYYQKSK